MRKQTIVLTFCGSLFLAAFPHPASADLWNHRTKLTFTEAIEVPGKVLPAGTYIFKLMDSNADRHIVQIFNADESQLLDTTITVPDKRTKVTGKTVVKFAERPSNSPEALKAWFYPGARYGEEFVYPHERAMGLARENKQTVLSTRSDMSRYMSRHITSDTDSGAVEMIAVPVMVVQPDGQEIEILEFYRHR